MALPVPVAPKPVALSTKVIPVRLVALGGTAAALFLVASIAWAAVSAALGLAALAGIALAAVAFFQALPLLGQKLENRLLAARKAEARANPIEQLQNYLTEKTRQTEAFREAVSAIGTQIKGLGAMVEGRRAKGRDVSTQERSLQLMVEAHKAMLRKYQAADAALAQLRETIEDKKFEFDFAAHGKAAMATLNAASGKEVLDAMLADEAFSAIRDNFNHVFSDLETEAARIGQSDRLDYDGMYIDLSGIGVAKQTAGVR